MKLKIYILAVITALAAGTVNGILGTGGGIILVIILQKILKDENSVKASMSSTLLCTLCMSVASFAVYLIKGHTVLKEASFYIIPSIIGGIAGGIIFKKIKPKFLNILFGLLASIAGIRMII